MEANMNDPDNYWRNVLKRKMDDIDQYHAFLILDLYNFIEDILPYKNIVMRSIKGDIKCYPDYMNDIENIVNRILRKNVEEVKSKDNYECLKTKDRNEKYYNYLDVLSERLLKIYNKYKSREDELIDKLINKKRNSKRNQTKLKRI
jgi:DNA topoisomerase VI subunit B